MASPEEFMVLWNQWNLNDRINFMRMAHPEDPAGYTWKDQLVNDWIAQQYGSLASYLTHPEIGPLLKRAAYEGWTSERIDASIKNTTWYRTTTDSQRKFDELQRSDPKTAEVNIAQMKAQITTLLAQEGVTLTDSRIDTLALTMLRNGTPENAVPRLVLAEVQFNPSAAQPVGRIGAQMSAVKQKADQYLIPIGDEAAFDWAKQIETGQAGQEAFDEYAKQIAKANYSWMADRLDAGATVRQIADPIIQTLAQEWGVSTANISAYDLAPTLTHDDGQTTRMMNANEALKYARSDDRFWIDNVRGEQEAAKFVQGLAQQLGRAA